MTTMNPEQMIVEAKAGSAAALGPLLELYRNYLHLLARVEIGRRPPGKAERFGGSAAAALRHVAWGVERKGRANRRDQGSRRAGRRMEDAHIRHCQWNRV